MGTQIFMIMMICADKNEGNAGFYDLEDLR